MFQQEFSLGDSLMHRLDPRVKLIAAAAFSVVTALLSDYAALGAGACAAIILIALARLPLRALARRMAVVNGFLLFLWLTLPITFSEAAALHIGPIGIMPEGFLLALAITIKSNAIVLAGIALLATNPPEDVARALSRLRLPGKIVHILLFMLRYLSEIQREYGWMRAAMKARAFRPKTDLRTYRAYAHLVGMLLVTSYEKAEAVHAAMMLRGFSGRFYVLDEHEIKVSDLLFAAVMTAAILAIILLQLM